MIEIFTIKVLDFNMIDYYIDRVDICTTYHTSSCEIDIMKKYTHEIKVYHIRAMVFVAICYIFMIDVINMYIYYLLFWILLCGTPEK